MVHSKYLILGAGPSGLTFAADLKRRGITDFILIEKEDEVGGLCRSSMVDGNELDIGGGHFLDVRSGEVLDFLFSFMPEREWNLFDRNSKIQLGGSLIDHPIEANIWQLSIVEQVIYLKSIASAGCNTKAPRPDKFIDWINWKLGDKIASDYMIPYNRKLFGEGLDDLGTYWLEKLPNVSYEETLMSCLEKKPYGKEPGHAKFYYPKECGYGEVWRRISKYLGKNLHKKEEVVEFDVERHQIKTNREMYHADRIITTIPWNSCKVVTESAVSEDINRLKHTSIVVTYKTGKLHTDAHWIYVPSAKTEYHRILVRHNFLPNSKGYWTETNMDRIKKIEENSFINEYAYPINTIGKPEIMERMIKYFHGEDIFPLGRWGEHQHYNSDVCVEKALELARSLEVVK